MHAVDLISAALPEVELPAAPVPGVCCVTGTTGPCLPRSALLSKTFTNLDLLRAPESRLVGVPAFRALTHKWERMSSWLCDGETFERLDRQGVRARVIAGEYPARWAAYATTSYKKHGSLWTPVNAGRQRSWRFEGQTVDCSDHERLTAIWTRLNAELRAGISRPVLETLEPSPFTFAAVGIDHWMQFERWARPLFRGALYAFLCYLLPSAEELKAERQEVQS